MDDGTEDKPEFEAAAVKQTLVCQIAEAMKSQNLSRKRLAERMKTSAANPKFASYLQRVRFANFGFKAALES